MNFRFTANVNAPHMNMNTCVIFNVLCVCMFHFFLLPAPSESRDKTCYCGSYLSLFVALLHQMIMLLHKMYLSVLRATCELK